MSDPFEREVCKNQGGDLLPLFIKLNIDFMKAPGMGKLHEFPTAQKMICGRLSGFKGEVEYHEDVVEAVWIIFAKIISRLNERMPAELHKFLEEILYVRNNMPYFLAELSEDDFRLDLITISIRVQKRKESISPMLQEVKEDHL